MPRGLHKRKCAAVAAGRAPKKNRPNLSDDKEFEDTSDADSQYDEEEVEVINDVKVTEEEYAECETLIRKAFYKIGMDVDSYPVCFHACVAKAIDTRMVHATSWSRWGGYKDFNFKLMCVAQCCKKTKKLHSPTAPAIVVAYVLLEIRNISRKEEIAAYSLMEICKTFDCAASAIGNYEAHPDVILKFDEAFEQPSSWPLMSRNKDSEQSQFAKIALVRRFYPRMPHHEQLPPKSKSPEAADAIKESDQTYEDVQVLCRITREEAQKALEEIIKLLRNLEWPESSLLQYLTLPRLKVLPAENKRLVLLWMKDMKSELFSEWKKETEEDLEQYQWTETVKRKIPETETTGPASAVFKRMEERAKEDPNPSSLEDLALLKKMFNNKATFGMDQAFYEKMDQWMLRLEHKADEQAAISAKVLKKLEKLDLVDGQVAEHTATIAKLQKKLDSVSEQAAEHAVQQTAAITSLQKKLDFVLAKQNDTSEPMMEDTEPCHASDNLIDFVDVKNPLFIDE